MKVSREATAQQTLTQPRIASGSLQLPESTYRKQCKKQMKNQGFKAKQAAAQKRSHRWG